jgi:hypothetical protein
MLDPRPLNDNFVVDLRGQCRTKNIKLADRRDLVDAIEAIDGTLLIIDNPIAIIVTAVAKSHLFGADAKIRFLAIPTKKGIATLRRSFATNMWIYQTSIAV